VKRQWIAWGPALSWAAVLFFLSELRDLPPELERFAELNDKVVHALLYSTLGMTLAWARRASSRTPAHFALLLAGYAYGALDELHQGFVPGRNPDVMDFAADVVGVTLGYLLLHAMWAIFFSRKPEPDFGSEPAPASVRKPGPRSAEAPDRPARDRDRAAPSTPQPVAREAARPGNDGNDRDHRHTRTGT
jgi:VanZ family protein